MGSAFLDFFIKNASYMAPWYPEGVAFFATDTEKFIFVSEYKFQVPFVSEGTEFSQKGNIPRVLQSGQTTNVDLDEATYGVSLKAITSPLYDDENHNRVIGTYGVFLPRADSSSLKQMADNFARGLAEISTAIQETASAAGSINESEKQVNEKIIAIRESSQEISKALNFIKDVAEETNMLGLNAAIEAARAGEAGLGFSVVAEEIRKLSEVSKNIANKINALTSTIDERIEQATKNSEAALKATEEQAAATEEITASIEEMTSLAEELKEMASNT